MTKTLKSSDTLKTSSGSQTVLAAPSGSDDLATIQAAVLALAARGGGTVRFAAGTYLVSGSVYVPSGITIQGAGIGATIVKKKSSSFVAGASNSANLTDCVFAVGPSAGTVYSSGSRGASVAFRDLTIDGNKANQTYTGITDTNYCSLHGIGARFVDTVQVERVRIQNTAQNGVFFYACSKTKTRACEFLNCGSSDSAFATLSKNGISHNGATGDVANDICLSVTDCYFSGCQDEGIQYGWAEDIVITGNHIYNSGHKAIEGDSAAGTVDGGATTRLGNCVIVGNFIRTCGDQGIGISNADNQKVIIAANQIFATAHEGIAVTQTDESSFLIGDNIVEGVGGGYAGAGSSYPAVYASGHKITIRGNKIYDVGSHGINVAAGRNVSIATNTIERCKDRAINVNIAAAATVDNLLIAENSADAIDGTKVIYVNVNGTILNLALVGNQGYNLGNAAASTGTTNAIVLDGASTVIRYLMLHGNTFTDRRSPVILSDFLNATGLSAITDLVADGNILDGVGAGINGSSKIGRCALGFSNIWESVAGTRTVTAGRTMQITDSVVLSNGTALTHSLPAAANASRGRAYVVRNIHASSACTVQAASGNVDGGASVSIAAGSAGRFVSDGTNWWSC